MTDRTVKLWRCPECGFVVGTAIVDEENWQPTPHLCDPEYEAVDALILQPGEVGVGLTREQLSIVVDWASFFYVETPCGEWGDDEEQALAKLRLAKLRLAKLRAALADPDPGGSSNGSRSL